MDNNEVEQIKERAVLVGVHTGSREKGLEDTTDESMEELARLADTAGAEVLAFIVQNRSYIEAATYVGEGKIEEIKLTCENLDANLIIFDDELTGSQIRNIENLTGVRVIDRSNLILDILAFRARTREGKIQVELAQLKYVLPRLTGLGASLSRLGGGIGTRGPGESKLESDRRHIRRRIGALESDLKEIKKHRDLIRTRRKKEGTPVVALVGYTNAGKSTLLNALTDADVFVEDRLFATLDPTIRSLTLSDRRNILMVDTVGFIRKLPHHLIESFKSTLEEAVFADVLLHVVDASSREVEDHIKVVNSILKELGATDKPVIMVYNKIDLRVDDLRPPHENELSNCSVEISAHSGYGTQELLGLMEEVVPEKKKKVEISVPYSDGQIVSMLHSSVEIMHEEYTEQGTYMKVLVDDAMLGKIQEYVVRGE